MGLERGLTLGVGRGSVVEDRRVEFWLQEVAPARLERTGNRLTRWLNWFTVRPSVWDRSEAEAEAASVTARIAPGFESCGTWAWRAIEAGDGLGRPAVG